MVDFIRHERQHHWLKTLPEYWNAVYARQKTFEVRKNDRDFRAGDSGCLVNTETGKPLRFWITYVLYGGQFGIADDYCVFGLDLGALPTENVTIIETGDPNWRPEGAR